MVPFCVNHRVNIAARFFFNVASDFPFAGCLSCTRAHNVPVIIPARAPSIAAILPRSNLCCSILYNHHRRRPSKLTATIPAAPSVYLPRSRAQRYPPENRPSLRNTAIHGPISDPSKTGCRNKCFIRSHRGSQMRLPMRVPD